MKVIRRIALAVALSAVIGLSTSGSVALAQEATTTAVVVTPVTQPVDDRDDGFPWGLLGLLGLAGLMGARPHQHEHTHPVERVDRTTTTRP
jgi:hypothetical protein